MGAQGETGNGRLEEGWGGGGGRDKTGEMNLQPGELPRLSDKSKNELQGRNGGLVRHGHLEATHFGNAILPSSTCFLIAFCSLFCDNVFVNSINVYFLAEQRIDITEK